AVQRDHASALGGALGGDGSRLGVQRGRQVGPEVGLVVGDGEEPQGGLHHGIGLDDVVAHRTSSPRMRRRAILARCRRAATVPGATPRILAASRWSKPSPSTSTTVTRWSTGSSASALRTVSDALTTRSGPGREDAGSTGSTV